MLYRGISCTWLKDSRKWVLLLALFVVLLVVISLSGLPFPGVAMALLNIDVVATDTLVSVDVVTFDDDAAIPTVLLIVGGGDEGVVDVAGESLMYGGISAFAREAGRVVCQCLPL